MKNTMESPDYGSEAIIKPDESTRLWCTRMYLDRAKQALVDVGGTYVPSKAEQRVELFDASIPAIREPLNNEQHIFARANFAESHPF